MFIIKKIAKIRNKTLLYSICDTIIKLNFICLINLLNLKRKKNENRDTPKGTMRNTD